MIIVNEIPDLKIFVGNCQTTKANDVYDYVASYQKEGNTPLKVYFKYTVADNGYQLNYYTETGEYIDYFIPFSPNTGTKGM